MRKFAFSLLCFIAFTYCSAQNIFTTTENAGFGTTSPPGIYNIHTYGLNKLILDVPNSAGVGQLKILNRDQNKLIEPVVSGFPTDGYVIISDTCFFTNACAGPRIASFNTSGFIVTQGDALKNSPINIDPLTGEFKLVPIQAYRISYEDTKGASTTHSLYSSSLQTYLKSATSIGLTSKGSGFVSVVRLGAGDANASGNEHDLAVFDVNKILVRSGNMEGRIIWRKLIIDDINGNVGLGASTQLVKQTVIGDGYAKKVRVTKTGWFNFVFAENHALHIDCCLI